MDADARAGDGAESAEAPVDVTAEEQAWDEAMHQALNIARAEGKVPGRVEETIQSAHASTLDWRTLLRRYMTDAASHDYSWSVPNRRFIDSGLYLPSIRLRGHRHHRLHHRRLELAPERDARRVLGGASRSRGRDPARIRHRAPGRHRRSGRGRVRRRRSARGDRGEGPGRHRLPPRLRVARRAGHRPRACASTSPTWSARTTPRPSLPFRSRSGSITETRPAPGATPRPGASTSGSPPDRRDWGTDIPHPRSGAPTISGGPRHDPHRHLPVLRMEGAGRPVRSTRRTHGSASRRAT